MTERPKEGSALQHGPPAIQPHGALLVANQESRVITHASANLEAIIGWRPADVLNQALQSLLASHQLHILDDHALSPPVPDLLKPWPCVLRMKGGGEIEVQCLSHVHQGSIYLELVRPGSGAPGDQDLRSIRQRMIDDLRRPDSIEDACRAAVRMVRELTGYDRVMCYRLHDQSHGEVIAEDTDLEETCLGLHYPAADLPDVMRRHLERNQIRMIADVDAEPVPIIAAEDGGDDLDIAFVRLRDITAAYRSYLLNMGAKATLSLPLVVNDHLWGLITCHHQTPRTLPLESLHISELAGQMIAIFIEGQQNAKRFQQLIKAQELAFAIARRATGDQDFIDRLTPFVQHIAELFEADSIVTRVDGTWSSLHGWESDEVDFTPLNQHLDDGMFVADRLGEYLSIADDLQQDLAGGVYLSVADGDEDYVFLGRREYAHTITWAGQKPDTEGAGRRPAGADDGERIEAPPAYGRWQEEVRGRSRPYVADDRETLAIVLQALRSSLTAYRDRRMMAARAEMAMLQAELRQQLLSNAGMASMSELAAALAHELNQPLTAISNFVNACRQMIRADNIAVPDELAALMDDAVNESQRAGEIVRRLRNFVQQGELERIELDLSKTALDTAKLALASKDIAPVELITDLEENLPTIYADPVQIEQVVFNLVRNSLEAMADVDQRIVTLSTRSADERTVEVMVGDTGPGIPDALLTTVFQPFRTSKREGMGIGLSLCRSIIEAHDGHIFCANTATGARFWFRLPTLKGTDRLG